MFRDPLELLVNPGTVNAAYEVGIADTNLASALLRGARPMELGVPSTTRLVITPTIRDELLATGGFTENELDDALRAASLNVRNYDQGELVNNLWRVSELYPHHSLSPDPAKVDNQLRDATIAAEARTLDLPILTSNVNDFNINVKGGGTLAKRLGVPDVIRTGNLNDLKPRVFPRLSDAIRIAARKIVP